jgi:hypothetical protein
VLVVEANDGVVEREREKGIKLHYTLCICVSPNEDGRQLLTVAINYPHKKCSSLHTACFLFM